MSELQLNKDFVLRKVCGLNVVLPTGTNVKDFGGALNPALVAAYDVTPETALADVQETIESLREAGVMA